MSYRIRLLANVAMLVVFLAAIMTLSFRAAQEVIVQGAEDHLRHAAEDKQNAIRTQQRDLLQYTDIIAADQRLQEYLYIITELGTSREGLAAYFDRQFASLPGDYRLILSARNELLLGEGLPGLVEALQRHLDSEDARSFYFDSPQGVMMIALAPVRYEGQLLAYAVTGRLMDHGWLNDQETGSADHLLFFERNGNVVGSSNGRYEGVRLEPGSQFLQAGEQFFRIREVALQNAETDVPRLWFGVSETRLMQSLERYERKAYLFALAGIIIILLAGWLMLRNFNRAFSQLMQTTQQMIDGKLPEMRRSGSRTQMDRLVNRFADVLDALRREQAEVKRVYRQLQETAITDSLTGLHNRRYLEEVAPGLFAQVVRDRRYLTGILLDLDFFKAINDQHGHLGGDAVLVHFSRLLKHNSRANDYLFRIGGEEFLILNVTEDPADSAAFADKLRQLVAASPANYRGIEIPMTVSAGISCIYGSSGEGTLSNLMRAADEALYEAKSGGRNRVVVDASCREASEALNHQQKLSLVSGGSRAGRRH